MKKVGKNCFDEQEKSWTYLKMFLKKHKNSKAIWAVNLKFLRRPTMVVKIFSRPWPPIYFSAATALKLNGL